MRRDLIEEALAPLLQFNVCRRFDGQCSLLDGLLNDEVVIAVCPNGLISDPPEVWVTSVGIRFSLGGTWDLIRYDDFSTISVPWDASEVLMKVVSTEGKERRLEIDHVHGIADMLVEVRDGLIRSGKAGLYKFELWGEPPEWESLDGLAKWDIRRKQGNRLVDRREPLGDGQEQ